MNTGKRTPAQQAALDDLGFEKAIRWTSPWIGYVLAVIVGRAVAGNSLLETGELIFGLPIAWLVGVLMEKRPPIGMALGVALVAAGLAVGVLIQV